MCKWWSVNVECKVERPAMRGKQGHARPNHERFRKKLAEEGLDGGKKTTPEAIAIIQAGDGDLRRGGFRARWREKRRQREAGLAQMLMTNWYRYGVQRREVSGTTPGSWRGLRDKRHLNH